jgi:hypothetical protein
MKDFALIHSFSESGRPANTYALHEMEGTETLTTKI